MSPRPSDESAASCVAEKRRCRSPHSTPPAAETKRAKWSPSESGADTMDQRDSALPTIFWETKQPATKVTGSGFHEFRVHYSETENYAVGDSVDSEFVSAAGHEWSLSCYPRGRFAEDDGQYVSIHIELTTYSPALKAIFQVFPLGKDGEPSFSHGKKTVDVYSLEDACVSGWERFMKRSLLESTYLSDGWVTFLCSIIVLDSDNIAVPPSNMGKELGLLLDGELGTDVSFVVKGRTFRAHRAILAARSPVFQAQLFGCTAGSASSITLQDIEPATFKAMLAFMYTDELPTYDELGDNFLKILQNLLAAADRYAMDRLKLMCASKLWDNISEHNFASILVCAETNNCPELKRKCFDFFAVDSNLKQIVFTDSFLRLMGKFQALAAELKERVGV